MERSRDFGRQRKFDAYRRIGELEISALNRQLLNDAPKAHCGAHCGRIEDIAVLNIARHNYIAGAFDVVAAN